MSKSELTTLDESVSDGWSAFDAWRQTIHEPRQRRARGDLGSKAAQVEPIQLVAEFQNAHL